MVRQTTRGSWTAVFRDNAAVQWVVLSGERRRCNGQWGGCSNVFVFYLHMGMGKIHWREDGDPTINRIKYRDIFYVRDIFFSTFFLARIFT